MWYMHRKFLAMAAVATVAGGLLAAGSANAAPTPQDNTVRTVDKQLFIPGNTMNGDFSTATLSRRGVTLAVSAPGDQAGYLRPLAAKTPLANVASFGYTTIQLAARPANAALLPTLQLGVYDTAGDWDGTLVYDPAQGGSTVDGTRFDTSQTSGGWWWTKNPDAAHKVSDRRSLADWGSGDLKGFTVGYYGVELGTFPAPQAVKASVDDVHIVTDAQDVTDHFTSQAAPPAFQPSVLAPANLCRVSASASPNAWQVTNVSGGRDRTFHAGVTYDGKTTWFGYPHTVKAGQSTAIVSPYGGRLTIQWDDGAGNKKLAYATSNHKIVC